MPKVRRRQRLELRKGDETDAPCCRFSPRWLFIAAATAASPVRCAERHYPTYQPSRSLPQKKVRGADAYLSIRR
jgi:hypothetical protein